MYSIGAVVHTNDDTVMVSNSSHVQALCLLLPLSLSNCGLCCCCVDANLLWENGRCRPLMRGCLLNSCGGYPNCIPFGAIKENPQQPYSLIISGCILQLN